MADVVVTTFTPVLGSGRAVRTYGVVAALALSRPVELVYQRFGAARPADVYEQLPNVTLHAVEPSRGLGRLAAVARARSVGAPLDLARAASGELGRTALQIAGPDDRIVADGPGAALAVLSRLGGHRSALISHNIEGDLDPRQAKLERRLLERFDETWMATRSDIARGLELVPGANLRYAPNVVDVDAIKPPKNKPDAERALFVADFTYAPNSAGLDFLLEDVMPAVWAQLPEAKLAVAGRGLDLKTHDPRVDLLGFVDDLGAEYARACAVVVPLLSGGGSPLKLIEGLAYARPIVATDHAAALIDGALPGKNLLAATDAQGFASLLAEAVRGKHKKVGSAGRKLAETGFSIRALAEQLGG